MSKPIKIEHTLTPLQPPTIVWDESIPIINTEAMWDWCIQNGIPLEHMTTSVEGYVNTGSLRQFENGKYGRSR